jgi:hypothetical protein
MSIAKRLKSFNRLELAVIAFFGIAGIVFLTSLPLSGYPPHVGFLAVASLITAYSLFTKRAWAPWLVAFQFIVNTVFSLYTLFAVGLSNITVALSMIALVILTWLVAIGMLLKRRS